MSKETEIDDIRVWLKFLNEIPHKTEEIRIKIVEVTNLLAEKVK